MKKTLIALGLSALLVVPFAPMTQGQAVAQERREGRARGEQRNNSKMKLTRLWRSIGQLEKSNSALTKDQAKRIVAVVRPWSSRAQMNDSQAESLYNQISAVLSAQQKSELQKMAAERRKKAEAGRDGAGRRGKGEGGQRRGQRREGGRGEGGNFDRQRMEQMRTFFKTVNPFYAPTGYKEFKSMPEPMQKGLARRYQAARDILVALSKKAG